MGSLQFDSRRHRSVQGSRPQGLDIQLLCTACDVLRDGNLIRQQDNRKSNANYASCTGEMSSEDKPRQQWQEGLRSSELRAKSH
ncbi:unnamed protein product [Heligmosomoides polygyrus]|uniref:Uncharacterized protein n=1 Tax=Heligmosomoides polygyrus TaxID=6339 RepID=A0A183GTC9_HELPZ|nr:unnamed protein product [Heligmosomoides polygyrus]